MQLNEIAFKLLESAKEDSVKETSEDEKEEEEEEAKTVKQKAGLKKQTSKSNKIGELQNVNKPVKGNLLFNQLIRILIIYFLT